LVLGIGNVLLGDEGVGVHVARFLQEQDLPAHVRVVDGGTGSFYLLEMMQDAEMVYLIDATVDADKTGTINRLEPRFSSQYPQTLTAHDIGLKDLIDAFHLLGKVPPVILFTVTIEADLNQPLNMNLSPAVEAAVPVLAERICAEIWEGDTDRHGLTRTEKICLSPFSFLSFCLLQGGIAKYVVL